MSEKTHLKLYVVGESSGNYEDWSEDGYWCLVFAENEEQAKKLCGDWLTGNRVALVVTPTVAGVMHWHSSARVEW